MCYLWGFPVAVLKSRQEVDIIAAESSGLYQVPVVEYLEEKLGIPVKMENDADAGALAEWKFGAGKGCLNMIFTFGTGLGSGLILNGQLYRIPAWLGKQVTYVWNLKDWKDMGKQEMEGFCSGWRDQQACWIFWHRRECKGAGRTG